MEDVTEAKHLDFEPIYFFDQMKPKRKNRRMRAYKDDLPHVKYTSGDSYSPTKSITSKEVEEEERLFTVAPQDTYSFYSKSSVSSKLSTNYKVPKICLQKSLFEEYKVTGGELLCELGKILQKYAEYKITFPVGIVNLVDYSWHDLIEGTYKYASQKSMLKKHNSLQGDYNYMTTIDKISNSSRMECHKENHAVKTKKDHHHIASRKSIDTKKTSLISQTQVSQISQESSSPIVIHFSLKSKICLENGWIFQQPYSISEILKWKTVLDIAVKKLQGAMIQIKTEEAKLKKEGFDKQLILRHYNDPEGNLEVSDDSLGSRSFWLELLRKPQMPAIREADPEMRKFHYALLDGSSVTYRIVSVMFNQDGGMVMSKAGNIVKEWVWPSKGKLDDPVEIWVNKFITVKISGRFAITLVYKWHPQSLKLSLAPVKCKSFPPGFPEVSLPDVDPVFQEARELFKAYKVMCKLMRPAAQVEGPSSLTGPANTLDPVMDISPMSDIATAIKLRRLQRKAKLILFNWLDHYRFALGIEPLRMCKVPRFPRVVRKQKVSPAKFPLSQSAKEKDENKEYLLHRNTFLKLKGIFKPSALPRILKTPASNQPCRLSLPTESKDARLASHLACPVVLRQTLCGVAGHTCRCSTHSIPAVTDLEFDHLIRSPLSSEGQIVIVCVFSAREKDRAIKEVAKVYREQNRTRSMPCIQSRSDPFRFLKYDIISASKFTGSNCPLLVQRHNVTPGIFLADGISSHSLELTLTLSNKAQRAIEART